jgi:hypothetical protein
MYRVNPTGLPKNNWTTDDRVPDPFAIRNEWFEIDFATWRVGPPLMHRFTSLIGYGPRLSGWFE